MYIDGCNKTANVEALENARFLAIIGDKDVGNNLCYRKSCILSDEDIVAFLCQ